MNLTASKLRMMPNLKRACLLSLVLFVFKPAIAQSPSKIDSIRKVLSNEPNNVKCLLLLALNLQAKKIDTVKVLCDRVIQLIDNKTQKQDLANAQNLISVYYLVKQKFDSAIISARAGFINSNEVNDFVTSGKCLINIGQSYYQISKFRNSIDTLILAEEILKKEKDVSKSKNTLVKAYIVLGDNYTDLSCFDLALKTLFKAKAMQDADNTLTRRDGVYGSIANVYRAYGKLDSSISFYKQAVQISESYKTNLQQSVNSLYNPLQTINSLCQIAINYFDKNQTDSAKVYIDKANSISISTKLNTDNATINKLKGEYFGRKANRDSALYYYTIAKEAYQNRGQGDEVAQVDLNLGKMFYEAKNYARANEFLLKSLDNYKNTESIKGLQDIYLALAKNEQGLGNYKSASHYYMEYNTAKDSVLNEEKIKAIASEEIKYETSLKELTIAKQQSEIKVQKQERNWIIGGGVFALLAASGLGFLYSRTKKQKAVISNQNILLEESNKTISKQKTDILHFQKNANQLLYSMFNRQAENELQKDNVKANKERVFAMSVLHALLYEKQDNILSLKEYLEKLCEAKAAHDQIKIDCKIENEIPLKAEYLKDIGIIVNELITNSIKYAFTDSSEKRIVVFVEKPNGSIHLLISDNGKGVPQSIINKEYKNSFGLDYVNDLVEQHDGTITTYNKQGANFEITLNLS